MRLACRDWPGDPARPALAIHCMMGGAAGWGALAARLDGRAALIAPDLPGHGRSPAWDPVAGPYHDAATAACAALRPQGPVDLIGHSLGATIALRLALAEPARLRGLTLIEPVLFAAAGAAAAADLPAQGIDAAAVAAGDWPGAARRFLARWGALPFDAMPPPAQDRLAAQMRLVVETGPVLGEDSTGLLAPGGLESLDRPVLIVTGGASPPVIAAIAAALAARLPRVRHVVIPGAEHMLPMTHAGALAEAILAGWSDPPGPRAG